MLPDPADLGAFGLLLLFEIKRRQVPTFDSYWESDVSFLHLQMLSKEAVLVASVESNIGIS